MARTFEKMMCLVLTIALAACGCEGARLTEFQNGVAPTAEYAGGEDTWVSAEPYEGGRDNSASAALRCGGRRRIFIRFDISRLPKEHAINRAVLRLADLGYPRKRQGKWPGFVAAYRLTRRWNDKASWQYHSRKNWRDKPVENAWKSPGGDLDRASDFGGAKKGLIAIDTLADGRRGHIHELDVTRIVRSWHAGALPNHGLALEASAGSPGCTVAAGEWHVAAYRPRLIVSHGPEGTDPAAIAPLAPAPKETKLDPVSATPDAGKPAGPYGLAAAGQNRNCLLRGASADAYIKEAAGRWPGTWGWMNMCRVGGVAGDFSRAMLYFDLAGVPRTTSIKQAKLRLTLAPFTTRQVSGYRYGAFLLKLPDSPPWTAREVTATHRAAGKPWPKGGATAAASAMPVAIGKVIARPERGRMRMVALEFDLTGAVRAWVQGKLPNCGILLDNSIEGGAYDFYSCRSFDPARRPYLEITLSPAIEGTPKPIRAAAALPEGDYWIEPMREVHKRFKGKSGTLAQYGDSITVSMAFLAYRFAKNAPKDIAPPRKELALKNTSPQVRKELDVVDKFSDRHLWWRWKGAQWGCTGQMMSDWLFNNIDGWQRKMNPEAAVIMFGTNDRGRICPPDYTEYMAASVRRMLADGTVPMLTTIPPPAVGDYRLAILSIAHGLKVPVIDYNAEMYRRRGDDWSGKKSPPGLISTDGVHPSHPGKYQFDFSEQALSRNGYLLRDYLTVRKYYQVIAKVLQAKDK